MEEDIRKKLSEIQDCIESAEWDLNNAADELNDL